MNVLNSKVKLIGFNDNHHVIFIKYLDTTEFVSTKYKNVNTLLIFLFKPTLLGEWKFKLLSNGTVSFKINNKYLIDSKNIDVYETSVLFNDSLKHAFTILAKNQKVINIRLYVKPPNFNNYQLLTSNNINLYRYLTTDDELDVLNIDLLSNGHYSSLYDHVRLKHWNFYREYLSVADLGVL